MFATLEKTKKYTSKAIKVKFTKGAFLPLEMLDIPEGANITISLLGFPSQTTKKSNGIAASAGAWKEFVGNNLKNKIYSKRLVPNRPLVKL